MQLMSNMYDILQYGVLEFASNIPETISRDQQATDTHIPKGMSAASSIETVLKVQQTFLLQTALS